MSLEPTGQEAQAEQVLYAKVLGIGMFFGLVTLALTFGLYVAGFPAPAVPLEQVPAQRETGDQTGVLLHPSESVTLIGEDGLNPLKFLAKILFPGFGQVMVYGSPCGLATRKMNILPVGLK